MNQVVAPEGRPLTSAAGISHSPPGLRRLAWLPVPAYIALIAILYLSLPRQLAASLVFDPPVLMLVLNTIFLFAISFAVFITAMRAYVASGSSNILLLGCGVLALGGAALAGGWVRPLGGDANTSVTIHNLGVLLGAVLHAMSALLTLLKVEPEQIVERRRQKLLFGFAGTFILIAIIIAATLRGMVPLFWAAEAGSTPLKQGVLGTAITLFALTSLYTMVLYVQKRGYLLYWYSIALALTSIGLIGITAMKAVGDPIGWAGRTAQYLGGVYFLIAALSALREAKVQGLTLRTAIDRFWRQSEVHYRDLVDTVNDAIISIDDRRRVLLWNQGAERMLGYTSSEAAGCLLSDLLMPEGHKDKLEDELEGIQKQILSPFASKELEIEMRRKDGSLFWSETSLSVRQIGAGWTATLVVRDITERKRAESVVQARLRMSVAASTVAMSVDKLLQMALDEIEAQTGSTIGFYHFLEPDQETLSLRTWSTNTVGNMCTAASKGSHYSISKAGVWVDGVNERRPVIHNDYASLPHRRGMPPGHAPVIREMVVPILRGGRIVAIIGVGNKPVDYHSTDIEVASILGEFSWEIVERKKVEESLQKSEARYRSYIEVTEHLGWTTDANGEVVEDIPSWRRFTGQSEEEVKGWGWSKALHPDDFEHTARVWRNAVATKGRYETEYRIRRYDKVYRHFLAHGVPVYKDNGDILEWVGTCIDITERKRAEQVLQQRSFELQQLTETLEHRVQERTAELEKANEALRLLSLRLLSAQEDERKRIAGELHDSIAASLAGMKFRIQKTAEDMKKGHGSPESLQDLASKVTEINNEVRRIMADLRPSILDDIGIIAAINWFCREYEKTYSHISVEKQIGISEHEVPDSLKTPIFRISQEAMNNIAKYSQASLMDLCLEKRNSGIELTIRDNGQGFDLNTVRRGLGLSTMRERAQLSGGSFTIESAEGKGTVVRASWPLGGTG